MRRIYLTGTIPMQQELGAFEITMEKIRCCPLYLEVKYMLCPLPPLSKYRIFSIWKENLSQTFHLLQLVFINHSWDGINLVFGKLFYQIYIFSTSFIPVGWEYLSLPSQYLNRKLSYFFFNINHKTDMNINEYIILLIYVELLI